MCQKCRYFDWLDPPPVTIDGGGDVDRQADELKRRSLKLKKPAGLNEDGGAGVHREIRELRRMNYELGMQLMKMKTILLGVAILFGIFMIVLCLILYKLYRS